MTSVAIPEALGGERRQLTHRYAPRGSAIEVMHSREGEVLMSGAAGTGKSRACLEKLLLQALKYPGMRGLILRKTQVSLGPSALKTWREDVATEALANRTLWFYGGSAEEPPQYRFANGSSIMIGGMDKPTKIMSTEYDVIYVQEAVELTETDWQHATTRLRNGKMPYQQIIADCNPDAPTHWLNARCDAGRTKMINCRHEDNPILFDEIPDETQPGGVRFELTERGRAYMAVLDALTGVRYLRLRKGLWVAAEGVIYDGFDPALHVIDEMPKGWRDWPRYWSVDFGFTNPFVCGMWAEDPDGRLYLYREFYMTGRTVDRHARDILDVVAPLTAIACPDCEGTGRGPSGGECVRCSGDGTVEMGRVWNEPRPHMIIADHDAENRARFETEIGLGTTRADKNVKDGIEVTQNRFALAADGRPRIHFLRGALVERDGSLDERRKPCSTLEEIGGYVWLSSPDGKPVKEEPRKLDDHGMDQMRYVCKERDPLARPNIRIMR
jgi:PBSX family phage terminase large subunit